MGHWARGEAWIPMSDWIKFVLEYVPRTDGELSFGPPREQDGEIVVPFALNTECHPNQESEPPEWCKK